MEYPMRLTKFDAGTAIRNVVPPLDPPELSPQLIIGHEKELTEGVREALRRHRDMVVRVLIDLDERPAALSLGPLTARLDEAKPAQRGNVDQVLDRLGLAILGDLEKLAAHRDTVVRQRALSVLSKVPAPQIGAILDRALDDERRSVREAAMLAAANHVARQGAAARPLVDKVASRLAAKRWQERKAAAEAMGRFGALADESALVSALESDTKAFVRAAAATSLGQLGSKNAVPALGKQVAARSEPNPAVRVAAVRALIAIGDGRAKDPLAEAARSDPSPKVREAAAEGAKRFR
jgi:HEAT repeat protein